ncbi:glycoside hydrolase family 35 protein [Glycomyces harbinensis]|uniref:Beta-galactosidase n=1 Tax=Glycomyces harbinensis TaxID=58114 RepID=A0A1G7BXL7_9ACTN|nr:beta-galactosidase family protein [Glycomyces harbinensis]SDE31844.1 beta-galactosidase [Glycomyces harbinensis]
MSRFAIGEHDFLLDGEPFRVLSGAIHYFRVHPDHWEDRIRKARLMGLNTIETYVPWNLHAAEPGAWTAEGRLDLDRFLRVVAAEGMRAIVRPGPYICAEFDNGGLPTWLFADPEVGIRRGEPKFMAAIGDYLRHVTDIVAPLQIDRGGPVVLMQVENEYGAYGDDTGYLQDLTALLRGGGITVPLTTVDQPQHAMLKNGSAPGLHMTASFGSRSEERLDVLRAHQTTGPLMSSEFWVGWFDSWGTHHHTTSAEDSAADLDALLRRGASVNIYMLHGGTNFGLTNGANDKGTYTPIATSYDYDAPLDEAGSPTAKYWAFREVIGRYTDLPEEIPAAAGPAPTGRAPLTAQRSFLASALALAPAATADVPTFAQVRHDAAFLLHTAEPRTETPTVLTVGEVRDRVHVVVDGVGVGVLSREFHERALAVPPIGESLVLLVENQGRVNYGPRLGEDKGLLGGVRLDGRPVEGWLTRAMTEPDLLALAGGPGAGQGPSLPGLTYASASFEVDAPADRFLDTSGLGKGIAWINGFCLGRYWSRGPQRTLYVPGPVLRAGTNEAVVLELDGAPEAVLRFAEGPDLGPLEF